MTRNEASWDRILRVVIGVGVLSLIFFGPKTWWGILGVVPLLTGVLGYCPLYQLVGFTSCPTHTPGKPRVT